MHTSQRSDMRTHWNQDDSHLQHGCIFIVFHLQERVLLLPRSRLLPASFGSSRASLWKNCLDLIGRKKTIGGHLDHLQAERNWRLPHCRHPEESGPSAPPAGEIGNGWETSAARVKISEVSVPLGFQRFLPLLIRCKFPWKGLQSFQNHLEYLQHAYPFICLFLPDFHNVISARYIDIQNLGNF